MFIKLLTVVALFFAADARKVIPATESNSCVSFQVSAGTGCAWMCNYCANTLGTTNYYFTDGVCTYETGGCVGTPQVGVLYTCCAA
jgi:hypothetical protein